MSQIKRCLALKGNAYQMDHAVRGQCYGYTMIWLYTKWLGQHSAHIVFPSQPIHDEIWFWLTLEKISAWDGNDADAIYDNVSELLELLIPLQSMPCFVNNASYENPETWFSDSKGRQLSKKDSRLLVFDRAFPGYKSDVINFLRHTIKQRHHLYYLSTGNHAFGIYLLGRGCGYFYDSNDQKGAIFFKNFKILAKLVSDTLAYLQAYHLYSVCYAVVNHSAAASVCRLKVSIGRSASDTSCERAREWHSFPSKTNSYLAIVALRKNAVVEQVIEKKELSLSDHLWSINTALVKQDWVLLKEALALVPVELHISPEYLQAKAMLAHDQGDFAEAVEYFEKYFNLDCTISYPDVWEKYASSLNMTSPKACIAFATRAIAAFAETGHDDKIVHFHYLRGTSHMMLNHFALAIRDFEVCLKHKYEPKDIYKMFFLASYKLTNKGPYEALDELGRRVDLGFPPLAPTFIFRSLTRGEEGNAKIHVDPRMTPELCSSF